MKEVYPDFELTSESGPVLVRPQITEKGWGREIVLLNSESLNLCCKVLVYDKKGSISSGHFHRKKSELFKIQRGSFQLIYHDEQGKAVKEILGEGKVIFLNKCVPHQLECLEDGSSILEVSTFHSDDDVVRIAPGDSQKSKGIKISEG